MASNLRSAALKAVMWSPLLWGMKASTRNTRHKAEFQNVVVALRSSGWDGVRSLGSPSSKFDRPSRKHARTVCSDCLGAFVLDMRARNQPFLCGAANFRSHSTL